MLEKIKNNKLLLIFYTVVIVLTTILISTQIPVTKVETKNLPIAVVNMDKGALGKQISEKINESQENSPMSIKITNFDNKEQLQEEMDKGHYYGAIVIPENFSQNIASLQSANPQKNEIEIIINQGKNTQVANQVNVALNTMANKLGQGISTQLLTKLSENNVQIPAKVGLSLINPLDVKTTIVHETGDLTNGAGTFFQAIWMASMISAAGIFTNFNKKERKTKKQKISNFIYQLLSAALFSITIGALTPFVAKGILGISIPNYSNVILFAIISSFAFISLILGFINLIGLPVIPLFALLLFFSIPVLQLAEEMVPTFYTNWIMPWLPMKFFYFGMKDVLFYGSSAINSNSNTLCIISLIGITLLFIGIAKK